MKLLDDFKKFALRGNAVDMAVGIIIGASFGKIVSSLVDDIIMPPVGMLIGGVDFSNLKLILREEPLVAINYGTFLNNIISFTIVAWAVFLLIKGMNTVVKKKDTSTEKNCPECQMKIPKTAKKCGHCTSVL